MGFGKQLAPRERVRTEIGVSAAIKGFGRNRASIRVQLRFTKYLAIALPYSRCDVYVGDGVDEGSVILHFLPQGTYGLIYIKSEDRTYMRFDLPPWAPQGFELYSLPCKIEWQDKERLKVWLPLEGWKKMIEDLNANSDSAV